MEKKLKFNKLGKIGITIPAIFLAGMFHCKAATFDKSVYNSNTSLSKTTVSYEKIVSNYSEKKALNTMEDILGNKLNTVTNKNEYSDNEIQEELTEIVIDMNANTLSLACGYNSLESNTIKNSGLTQEQYNNIATNHGANTTNEQNLVVARSAIQHYMHIILDTQATIRLQADEAEIAILDERDGKNQYFKLTSKDKRDVRNESFALLNTAEKDIIAYCEYEYAVHGQDGANIAKQIKNNLTKIKDITTKAKVSENDYILLTNLVTKTADLLPEKMFGTQAMRRGVILEFASQYAMNRMLSRLQILGYDVSIQPEALVKNTTKMKNKVDLSVNTNTTNKYTGIGFGLDVNTKLPHIDNANLTIGGEINTNIGYKKEYDSTQALTKVGLSKKLNNNNDAYVGLKGGLQFDNNDISIPLGFYGGYKWNINDNFALDFCVNTLGNAQRMLFDIGTAVGATFKTKNVNIKLSIGFGYTFDLNPILSKTNQTDTSGPGIYGEDEIEKTPQSNDNNPDNKTPEEDPIDLEKYL